MYHVSVAGKDLLVGDEATELLVKYAALLGQVKSADEVTVNAISGDGDSVEALFLLNGGLAMMAETSHSSLPEPENYEAIAYLHSKINAIGEFDIADFGEQ